MSRSTTSGSIRATAVDAMQQGFRVIFQEKQNNSMQTSTLLDLNARYADVVTANQLGLF